MEHSNWLAAALVYLGAAIIAVPLAKKLGLGSIIGYLAAGIAIGPFGLGLVRDTESILHVAEFGVVNVSLHRDDYAKKGLHSQASPTSLPFDVDNRKILLIDDVLSTGRTVRAAVNELYDYGRPASVELAVLADRGGRELPMAARFTGGVVDVPANATLVLARRDDGTLAFTTEARTD